jgi:hypothetical protein
MSDKSPSMIRLMIREALRSTLNEDDQDKKPEEPKKPEAPKEPKAGEPAEPPQQAPKEESPAELAQRLGLIYQGWGKYADSTGKVVAKTVQGHLVRVQPGEEMAAASSTPDDPNSMDGPTGEPSDNGEVPQAPVRGSGQYENPYEQPVALGSSDGRTQKIKRSDIGPVKKPTPEIMQARQPGTIDPPLTKDGNPIEIEIQGKKGFVDYFDVDTRTAYVTFEDGTFGQFSKKDRNAGKYDDPESPYYGQQKYQGPHAGPDAEPEEDDSWGDDDLKPIKESEASDQAAQLGLTYIGFGRYIDQTSGKVVAKSVDGRLVKLDVEEEPDMEPGSIDPVMEKALNHIFDSASDEAYNPKGLTHKSPGWNKDMDMVKKDVAFDANAEKTVQKLLAKVGDPMRLIRWLLKKFREETTNGKKRILQYLGVLKDMGIMPDADADGGQGAKQNGTSPDVAQQAPRQTLFDL